MGRSGGRFAKPRDFAPPSTFFPCLWRGLAHGAVRVFGLPATLAALPVLGPLLLAFVADRTTRGLHAVLTALVRTDRCRPDFRQTLVPVLAVSGAALFISTQAVFCSAWSCSPELLQLILLVLIADLMGRFFFRSSVWCGAGGLFLTGVLAADGPLGFVALAAIVVLHIACRQRLRSAYLLSDLGLYHVWKWVATGLFLLGFVLVAGLNAWFFVRGGGSWSMAFAGFWPGVATVDLALVASLVVVPRATDIGLFLPYVTGLLLLLCGTAAFLYLIVPELTRIPSFGTQVLFLLAATVTLVAVMAVVLVEVCCRNHQVVLFERFGIDPTELGRWGANVPASRPGCAATCRA